VPLRTAPTVRAGRRRPRPVGCCQSRRRRRPDGPLTERQRSRSLPLQIPGTARSSQRGCRVVGASRPVSRAHMSRSPQMHNRRSQGVRGPHLRPVSLRCHTREHRCRTRAASPTAAAPRGRSPTAWTAGWSASAFESRSLAVNALARARAQALDSLGIAPADGKTTLAEYAPRWLAAQQCRPSTLAMYDSHVRNHIVPMLGR
jgi:hypothetical protein